MSYYPPGPPGAYPPAGQAPPPPVYGGGGVYPPPPGGCPPPPGAYPPPPGAFAPPGAYPPPAGAVPPFGSANPPMDGTPVLNPTTPYIGPLPRLQDGLTIFVQGYIPAGADRFYINLSLGSGLNEAVDTAMHVNPRFPDRQVVRNSYIKRSWGKEERGGPAFPLQHNQPFECIILVTNTNYRIAFNGNHFCEYGHRIAMDAVSHLAIGGNVGLNSVRLQGPGIGAQGPPPPYTPPMPAPPPHMPPAPVPPPGPGYNLPVPFKFPLGGGLRPGMMIQIGGMVEKPGHFAVNLAYYEDQSKNVAFHFNPRFNQNEVVRNTLNGTSWGKEEKAGKFPFTVGQHFELLILVEADKYKVAVNNAHFCQYNHRLKNLANTRHLCISGDVKLSKVQVY